jgi:mRNA-degrading endonuclease RelE of RelBE toxin-antitoxin system
MRPSVRRAFVQAVMDLKEEGPRPSGWIIKQLHGKFSDLVCLKLDYRHRMIYSVVSNVLTIEIIEVSTRENAYK